MRQIIHVDLDAFFASVEVLLTPNLAGKPLVVAMGNPQGRGVVSTASYEARKFGIHSAMPLREAIRLCPKVVIVPVRHHVYSEHSRRVMDLLREYTPLVEQVSIDEAYVEIEPGRSAEQLAAEMQSRIRSELGLDCSVGVATNKLLSKIACNTVKPRGLVVVREGEEERFLAPLPVSKIPGAGPATRARLERWGVKTIGDLARVPAAELTAVFGKHGAYLSAAAHGQGDSRVITDWKPQSISQENTFDRDTRDSRILEKELGEMSARVARELEHEGYLARTVVLKLRFADFTTITRQTTLRSPIRTEEEIRAAVLGLLNKHWNATPVRLIGVGAQNLVEEGSARQMELGLG